jgi:hypothetical protein
MGYHGVVVSLLNFVLFLAVLAAVPLFQFARKYYSPQAVLWRRLTRAPLRTTAEFPENTVGTVQGTLRYLGDAPLIAPLTGRPCACYDVIIEEKGMNEGWDEIIRESQCKDFLLEDEHGVARVQMDSWEVLVVKDMHFQSGMFRAATPELEAFLARNGQTSADWIFNKSIRYREGVLEAGEAVAVCGTATREVDPDPRAATGGYRDTAMRLVLTAGGGLPLYVSDDVDALR